MSKHKHNPPADIVQDGPVTQGDPLPLSGDLGPGAPSAPAGTGPVNRDTMEPIDDVVIPDPPPLDDRASNDEAGPGGVLDGDSYPSDYDPADYKPTGREYA